MVNWLQKRLPPVKAQTQSWQELAEAIQTFWEENFDSQIERLRSLMSIFTASASDQALMLHEAGGPYESHIAPENIPLAYMTKRRELFQKGTEALIMNAIQRVYPGLECTWKPLYARVEDVYGTAFYFDGVVFAEEEPTPPEPIPSACSVSGAWEDIYEPFDETSTPTGWSTYTHYRGGSVTFTADGVELHSTTGTWCGAHIFTTDALIPKSGIVTIDVDWLPHRNKYSSAPGAAIVLCDPDSPRHADYYGGRTRRLICVGLSDAFGGDAWERSAIALREIDNTMDVMYGALNSHVMLATGTPTDYTMFDETIWNHLSLTMNFETRLLSVVVGLPAGSISGSCTIGAPTLASMGNCLTLEFSNGDYDKNNKESFKNLIVGYQPA